MARYQAVGGSSLKCTSMGTAMYRSEHDAHECGPLKENLETVCRLAQRRDIISNTVIE